jgi:hypothetical protein
MMRVMGLVSATFVASQLVGGATLAATTQEPAERPIAWHPRHPHRAPKVALAKRGVAKPAAEDQEQTEPPPGHLPELSPDVLSPQELRVRNIALMNGDRMFLMVDKGMGKILLFEDGKLVFMGNALTGESYADRLLPAELSETMDSLNALDTKITPAGRFTVTHGYNKDYGPLLDVNQIKGKDWGIAIHQVYLGIPSEHRASRLQSPREADKNITFGCINVAPDAIHLLLRELPDHEPSALYVLPRDETQTVAFFAPRNS